MTITFIAFSSLALLTIMDPYCCLASESRGWQVSISRLVAHVIVIQVDTETCI